MGSKTAKTACSGLEADDLGGRAGETWKLVLGKIEVSLLVKRPDRPASSRSPWEGLAQVSELDLGRVLHLQQLEEGNGKHRLRWR